MSSPNKKLAARLTRASWALSIVVWILVGVMRRFKIELPDGVHFGFLPPIHAALNTLVAILLVAALVAIKNRRVQMHRRLVSAAMLASATFLLCYVAYHLTTEETRYGGEGIAKTVYLLLLLTHIVLAAVSLPFILQTWIYGFTQQIEQHRKMAKWVFPVWLYVAITGPVCYLMLRPYY